MSRYLRLTGLFILLQGLVFALLVAINSPSAAYLAAVTDKSRLLATADSPRIVLVGDSSLAFGIDSRLIETQLAGRYHPVNMGLHGGLGLDFELNQALAGVRPGDFVVLCPAYDTLWDDSPSGHTLWSALLHQPGAWTYVPDDQKLWLLGRVILDDEPLLLAHDIATISYNRLQAITTNRLKNAARQALGREAKPGYQSAYTRSGFNEYGDQTNAWNAASMYSLHDEKPVATPFPAARVSGRADILRQFAMSCRRKGVAVVYAYPAVPEDWYRENEISILRTSLILESRLSIPFINEPPATVYSPTDFFDTRYHLRGAAVQRRTLDLVRDLRPHIATP